MKIENKERLLKLFRELDEAESLLEDLNRMEDAFKNKNTQFYFSLRGKNIVINISNESAKKLITEKRINVTQKIKDIKNEVKFL